MFSINTLIISSGASKQLIKTSCREIQNNALSLTETDALAVRPQSITRVHHVQRHHILSTYLIAHYNLPIGSVALDRDYVIK